MGAPLFPFVPFCAPEIRKSVSVRRETLPENTLSTKPSFLLGSLVSRVNDVRGAIQIQYNR